jgi:hypothetical protein
MVILTAAALKQAVEHFANPSWVGIGMEEWTQRRFDAVRFVLATGRAVNDTRSGLPGATVAASRPTPR